MNLESLKEFATERQCQVIDAIAEHGSQSKAAKALDINPRTLERSLQAVKRQAARRGWSPEHGYIHSVPDTHVVKGVSTYHVENRQWVKSDLKKQSQEDALQSFADALIEDLPKYKPTPYKFVKDLPEHLTAYVIGDAHIGMKVTAARNGDADWNLEIAERVTVGAIEKLINATGGSDTALMLDLGDFGHSDNLANTTSSGQNHMDMDGDYGDSIAAQVRVYRRSIDLLLAAHNKVILMMVRGNHNSSTSRCMNIMLQAFYENETRVQVLDNAMKFQNIVWGSNLLVTHHGDKMAPKRAFEYIVGAMSESWGACKHRYCLMGHIHHETSVELGGMLFSTFQALPSSDAWHVDSGFTGAKRTMSAIVYDKDHGEIQRHKVGIGQLS
jgi:metallophosphoesterase superfamily enzyme